MNESPFGDLPAPIVSVVIPSWNAAEMLARCLRSLEQERTGASPEPERLPIEVIVVDDASRDDSAELVRRRFPWAQLLSHDCNRGFAATCNDGARVARGEWLLFLNSDAFVGRAQIARLQELADALGADAIGPQLVYGEGRLQDSGGMLPGPSAITRTKLGRLLRRDIPGASHVRAVRGTTRYDWICGACLLVRADVFRSVGGFDERLTYVEDVELGTRITRGGGLVLITDQVTVTHLSGESFRLIASAVPRLYRDSQHLLAKMYFSPLERAAFAVVLAVDGLIRHAIRGVSADQ